MRSTLFCLLLVAGVALAQGSSSPPGASPRTWALPSPPENTRLPGADPRECGTSIHQALCAIGRWSRFARMDVTLKTGGFTGHYEMERPENGEVLTLFTERAPSGRRGGEVLLVGEDAFAYRTREQLPADVDVLDYLLGAPNMTMQLAAVLLDQAVLEAPASVTAQRKVAADSTTQYIRTETPNTAAVYAPPWRVSGSVRPTGANAIAFTLDFQYRPVDKRGKPLAGRTDRIELSGVASYGGRKPTMPDTFDLVGWKLIKAGQPAPAASTLEEARRSVAQ